MTKAAGTSDRPTTARPSGIDFQCVRNPLKHSRPAGAHRIVARTMTTVSEMRKWISVRCAATARMARPRLAQAVPDLEVCLAPVPPSPTSSPSPTPFGNYGKSLIDVTYCSPDGLPQKMDIYFPKSGGPWPVFLYVHGGGWDKGDKAEGAGWNYLNDKGYLVVSVNYRLAAYNIKFPAMIEDVKCAVRYLRAHALEYNLNPDRIGALGASAGGHLVALLGTSDKSAGWDVGEYLDQSSRVQAVIPEAVFSDFTQAHAEQHRHGHLFCRRRIAGFHTPASWRQPARLPM